MGNSRRILGGVGSSHTTCGAYCEASVERHHLKNDDVSPYIMHVCVGRYKGTSNALPNVLGLVGSPDAYRVVLGVPF